MKIETIKTKRLCLTPMTEEALQEKMAAETDAHMKNAYGEMLAGMAADPGKAIFYTDWRIALCGDDIAVGGAGFKGPPADKTVEIGYEIDAPYRKQGYGKEAVEALTAWAFKNGAYFVAAETEPGNEASEALLTACGFHPAGKGAEGARWEKEAPASAWLPIFMCLGVSVGCCFGSVLNTTLAAGTGTGAAIGIAVGLTLGACLDAADRKARLRQLPQEEAAEESAAPPEDDPADKPGEDAGAATGQ